jgi:hypothetical protein
MTRRLTLWRFFFIFFLLSYPTGHSYAQSPKEIKNQLIAKGFSEEVINIVNPRCQERLNTRVPEGVTWYATFDRDSRSITVDFRTEKRTHNSITVVSLKENGCTTIQNNVMVTIGTCKEESESWIQSFKKRGIKLKIEEEDQQHVFLSAEGNLGMKVYLYSLGNMCMHVFRNVETIK